MKQKLNKYSALWLISLISVLAVMLIMWYNKDFRVCNILEIEFSSSLDYFRSLVKNQESTVHANTILDFVFIIFYSFFFIACLKVAVLSLQTKLNTAYYLLCLLPGLFDVLENYSILNLIENQNQSDFQMLYVTARIKWAIVIPFMLMALTILIYYVLIILRKTANIFIKKNPQH